MCLWWLANLGVDAPVYPAIDEECGWPYETPFRLGLRQKYGNVIVKDERLPEPEARYTWYGGLLKKHESECREFRWEAIPVARVFSEGECGVAWFSVVNDGPITLNLSGYNTVWNPAFPENMYDWGVYRETVKNAEFTLRTG